MQKNSDINKIIKDRMKHYLQEIGIRSLQDANTRQLGKSFTEFYVKDILSFLYQFDEDLIDEGLKADGSNDLNIDFVYQDDDNFTIIQSKYQSGQRSLGRDDISGFLKIHSRILDKDFFSNNASAVVKNLLDEFTSRSNVNYILLTNSNITTTLEAQFHKEKDEEIRGFDKTKVNFALNGLSEIKNEFKTAQTFDEPIPEKVEIPIERLQNRALDQKQWSFIDLTDILEDQTIYSTILTTIKGTVLKNLYKQYKGRLFNYNIRGYLGSNVVNKKMVQTIDENPNHFYLFNNGISAICSDLDFENLSGSRGLQIACNNFQIINGAQTATTIGLYKNDDKLKDVRILLRITKTENIKKEKKGLNKKIILYNNSQTIIKASDFRSNDEIQTFLETNLKKFSYRASAPYQKIVYLPKRMKYKKRKDEIYINMEILAKALYAYEYGPTKIYANSKFLFDIDSNSSGKYWYLFGDDGEECIYFEKERLKKVAAISILWLWLSEKLKTETKKLTIEGKSNTIDYLSCLSKWHFLWAYGYIIKRLYEEESTWIFNKLIDGKAFQGSTNFADRWFEEISAKLQERLDYEYIDASEEDSEKNATISGGFNFKNWLRNQKSFEKLKIQFKRVTKTTFPLTLE